MLVRSLKRWEHTATSLLPALSKTMPNALREESQQFNAQLHKLLDPLIAHEKLWSEFSAVLQQAESARISTQVRGIYVWNASVVVKSS